MSEIKVGVSKKVVLTDARLRAYLSDAKTINMWRANPAIASEQILGIALTDAQSYMVAGTWTAKNSVWSCTRGFGKSFLIADYCLLRALLFPNQNIYIISSKGDQAKETFTKLEEIIKIIGKTADSIPDAKRYAQNETVKSPTNKDGFNHNPQSWSVSFYNGSKIFTLNSTPDNIRGKRANLVVYDEAAFCSDSLIIATEPFTTQDAEFKVGLDIDDASIKYSPTPPPFQRIYASSQDSMDTIFYQRYKQYTKKMLMGDRSAFTCDMPCGTAFEVYRFGKKIRPLLSKDVVEDALKANPDKGRREYFNKPDRNGGDNQIIKWKVIRDNEKQIIPYDYWKPENKVVLAFDPARTSDNSILTAMNIVEDPELGICGEIIGCFNFIDIATKKKYKLDSNRQLEEIRNIIAKYNGDNPDYEFIDKLLIDAGAGGGGTSTYADQLLNDWVDENGKVHKGLIDADNELYSTYKKRYPNAVDKLELVSPRKWRTKMVEQLIELMNLGVIKFPYEYNGGNFLRIVEKKEKSKKNDTEEEVINTYNLSQDEMKHLVQIDLMKTEVTSIYKSTNNEGTSVNYALAKEKQNKMHDDRFYTLLLLAKRLYELRRGNIIKNKKQKQNIDALLKCKAPKIL